MPEGPEVRITAEKLHALLKGQTITLITVVDGPFRFNNGSIYANFRRSVAEFNRYDGNIIVDFVRNKGKYIYMRLVSVEKNADGSPKYERFLFSHLSLGGNWLTETGAHTMVVIRYQQGRKLYYHDHRRRGKLYLFTRDEARDWLARIGPDVLSRGFTREVFDRVMALPRVRRMTIDIMLMKQEFFSGIGNYLRAEILNEAKIDPRRNVSSLGKKELAKLYEAIIEKTRQSYAAHGTTIDEREGGYIPVIYGKKVDPLGNPIATYVVDGRTMYWVPAMQK